MYRVVENYVKGNASVSAIMEAILDSNENIRLECVISIVGKDADLKVYRSRLMNSNDWSQVVYNAKDCSVCFGVDTAKPYLSDKVLLLLEGELIKKVRGSFQYA